MEEGPSVSFEQHRDGEDEEELSEVDADVVFQVEELEMEELEMERDEKTGDQEDLGEDWEVDNESDQEGSDYGSDYIPTKIQGSHGRAGVSRRHTRASNSSKTFMRKQGTKDSFEGGRQKNRNLAYEFCPPAHRRSILRLLTKHFCLHPLLPERHGQPRTSYQTHRDSVHEMYLHCKNNHLREVWAYLWTNWYSPNKWKLWARSAYPNAIP